MRILIVDDDPGARMLLSRAAKARRFEVTACATGEEAWAEYEAAPFPVCLVDWVLPGLDGLALVKRIRRHPAGERTVIIVATAKECDGNVTAALDARADDFLSKPLDVRLLQVRLRVAARWARALDARERSDAALRAVAATTATGAGERFFELLVTQLARALQMSIAFVGELRGRGRARTLAACQDGVVIPPFGYELAGTPCADVCEAGELRSYERDLQSHFPEGALARTLGAECYLGLPLLSETGVPIGVLAVADRKPMTIGPREKAVARIFAARAGLELQRQKAEVRSRQAERLAALGALAGGVAHDFNNLLVAVIGNAELAQAELPQGHPAAELLPRIVRAGLRASELCRKLLAYAGRGALVRSRVDLAALVRSAAASTRTGQTGPGAVTCDVPPGEVWVEGDTEQLPLLLENLQRNAVAASGAGGGVSVSLRVARVDGSRKRRLDLDGGLPLGPAAELVVQDDGPGIPREIREHLFDPFHAAEAAGRGLGLPAVAGIVRSHRGGLSIESPKPHGTRVVVLLPLADPEKARLQSTEGLPAAAPEIPPSPQEPARLRRALVIDDEEGVRRILARILEHGGWEVETAKDGTEGIRRHQETRPDLVLVDLTMPDLDGLQVLDAIREVAPTLPAIVMSGYAPEAVASRLDKRVGVTFLSKPFHLAAVRAAIRAAADL